ncbi:MAG: TlpA disulfide reductase family protein [Burkholderiales bacterium]|nr:TlpA disulfide reductase family protein [Burkholderiales bacterium]
MPDRPKLTSRTPNRPLFSLPAARRKAAIALAVAVLYGTGGGAGNAAETIDCAAAAPLASSLRPTARGEVAAVQVARAPKAVPNLSFAGPDGRTMTLADFRGRTVLLNLWATWCAPCRKEMPALDTLQKTLGGADFEVVAINIDTRNLDKPRAWLVENGITTLAYFADPTAKVFQELKSAGKAFGMPTTLIIDPSGCELATLAGPAEWASEDALAMVRAALGR